MFCYPIKVTAKCYHFTTHFFRRTLIFALCFLFLFTSLPSVAFAGGPLVPLPGGTSPIGFWQYIGRGGKLYYHFVFETGADKVVFNVQRVATVTATGTSAAAVGLGAIAISIPAATVLALKQIYDREQNLPNIEIIDSTINAADGYSLGGSPLELVENATSGTLPASGDSLEFVRSALCASIENSDVFTDPDPCTADLESYKVLYNKSLFRACVALEKWYRFHNSLSEDDPLPANKSAFSYNSCFIANQTNGRCNNVDQNQRVSFNSDGSSDRSIESDSSVAVLDEIQDSVNQTINGTALNVIADLGLPDGFEDDEFSTVITDACWVEGLSYGIYEYLYANYGSCNSLSELEEVTASGLDETISRIFLATTTLNPSLEAIGESRDLAQATFLSCLYCHALPYFPYGHATDRELEYGCYVQPTPGCTDAMATNFDSSANEGDGSCDFEDIATPTPTPTPEETVASVLGCTNGAAINYDSSANEDDGSCDFEDIATPTPEETVAPVFGCTEGAAINYDSGANEDDGSCYFWESATPDV